MPSNFKISDAARNASADGVVDLLDGGTGNGRIEIRDGVIPTNPSDISNGNLLATLTFAATAFGNAVGGTATANPIASDTNAAASGAATYFRCYPGAAADTACTFQGTAGESADSPDMVFDNKNIVAGGTVAISSMTYTQPVQ